MTPETTDVIVRPAADMPVKAEDFMPLMTVQQAVARKGQINDFIAKVMKEGEDYGEMPGGQKKKVLLKPGAEKLCSIFGMAPQYVEEKIIEDWTGAEHGGEPLFYYAYRCSLSRGGKFMGEGIGSCNSWESKYRYRWISEDAARLRPDFEQLPKRGGRISEPAFAINRAETTGRYGKPAMYWQQFRDAIEAGTAAKIQKPKKDGGTMEAWEIDSTLYRIPNPEISDTVNTCQKMAQKRALVAAVLVVTNCSDAFTQDVEDFAEEDRHEAPSTTPAAAAQPQSIPPTSGRPVPEELTVMFANIDKDSKAITTAFNILHDAMVQKGGELAGTRAYQGVIDGFRKRFPKGEGKETKGDIKDALLDLWAALDSMEQKPEIPA